MFNIHSATAADAALDSVQVDSVVSTQRFSSYKTVQADLEKYFDSGNEQALQSCERWSRALATRYGDAFYVRQTAKYRVWRETKYAVRESIKQKFAATIDLLRAGETGRVAKAFEDVASQFLELGDSAAGVKALQYAGSIRTQGANPDKALQMLHRSLVIARAIGDLDGTARGLNLIGDYFQKSGYFVRAGSYFDSSQVVKDQLGDEKGVADCLNNISAVHLSLDNVRESYRFAAEALRLRRQLADSAEIYQSLLNMIGAFRHSRPDSEVTGWLTNAESLSRNFGDSTADARLLQAQGMIASDNGDIDGAAKLYQSALTSGEARDKSRLTLSILANLAALESSRGDYEAALKYYVEEEDLARKSGNQPALAMALHNIGTVYQQLGAAESAISYYRRSLEIRRRLKLPNEMIETLTNLGDIYLAANDLQSAHGYLRQATDIAGAYDNPRLLVTAMVAEARLRQRQGIGHRALAELDSVLTILRQQSDEQRNFDVEIICADYARQNGDWERAVRYLEAAKELAVAKNTYANRQRFDLVAGLIWYDRGQEDSALTYLTRVVSRLEQSRRSIPDVELRAFQRADSRFIYEAIIDILARRCEESNRATALDSLLRYVDLAKSQSWLEMLQRGTDGVEAHLPAELVRQEKALLAKIDRAEAELVEADSSLDQKALVDKLTGLNAALAEIRLRQSLSGPHNIGVAPATPVTLQQASSSLKDARSAVVNFLLMEKQSVLILITKDGGKVYPLQPRQKLTEELASYLALLQKSVSDEALSDSLRRTSEAMAKLVLGPLGDLSGLDRLSICPDGALSLLPFESLTIDGKYLIERVEVSYTPNLGLFISESNATPPAQPRLLVLADPTPSDKLKPLPYSLHEADWIAELFPADRRRMVTGKDLSKSVLMSTEANEYQVIHVATHSTINQDDPLRSRIWLSPDTTADSSNYLSLADVTRMKLSADLVVLSSCESGGGRFQLGEGIEGFVQGFMMAGCHNVVVSLWEVEDFATAVLMKEFYRNLDLGYAGALRQAKLSLIESPRLRLRHPYYWASFVLERGS